MKLLKNMIFMTKYSWRINRRSFLAAAIDIILRTAEPFIYLIPPKFIIDELAGARRWNAVLYYVGVYIVSILSLRFLSELFRIFINMSINRSDVKNAMDYARNYVKTEYQNLEDAAFRDIQEKVSRNVHVNSFLPTLLTDFFTGIFTMLGFAYLITTLEPLVLVFIGIFTVLHYIMNRKTARQRYEYQPILARLGRMFEYLFSAMTRFDFAKEVRINRADKLLSAKLERNIEQYREENNKFLLKQFGIKTVSSLFSFVQMLLSYGYTAFAVTAGHITVGSFSMYISAIYSLSGSFENVVGKISDFKYLSKCVDDYYEYIGKVNGDRAEREVNPLPAESDDCPVIEYDHVSFTYPNTDKQVLKNVSIKIEKGEKLSVVGLNGAGKTTFIKLLCRLYEPSEGCIKYYGTDIRTIRRDEYLRAIGMVFQDYKIFSFSFLDNVILNRAYDEKRFREAAEKSGIAEKLASLPHREQTNIYKDFDEEGTELSGGEGQKLVIARAYYKDARLVILDEPTASLDAVAESGIYNNFSDITCGKTAIFISHRLASSRFCDHIAVFCDGEIVEYGSHGELLSRGGLYSDMFCAQAMYYEDESVENPCK